MAELHYILQLGQRVPLDHGRLLCAGNLLVTYQRGFLRYFRHGEHEVLRMINHAVRDRNWNTCSYRLFNERINDRGNSFTVSYDCETIDGGIDMVWHCRIEGSQEGEIRFEIVGAAREDFMKNRAGFTILHPTRGVTGESVKITHPNGSQTDGRFPQLISPHQPFQDITGMEWSVGSGHCTMTFEGDVFEMEDQRNWIDDSFKTYCTPLSLPFPALVKKGEEIRQKITLTVQGSGGASVPGDGTVSQLVFAHETHRKPRLGVARSSEVERLSEDQVQRLRGLGFHHYLVDVKMDEDWAPVWEVAAGEAAALALPLEVSLFLSRPAEQVNDFIDALPDAAGIWAINVFDTVSRSTQESTLQAVLSDLRAALPQAKIGAGTNAFFTELNRDRTPPRGLDHLVYSVNPQVHASDYHSVVETIAAVPATIETTRSFAGQAEVHVSPVTFKMRWNPNATGEEAREVTTGVDLRQMSLFGAGWTLGSVQQMVAKELSNATFFESVGMKGLIQSNKPLATGYFPAEPNAWYPLALVFWWLNTQAGDRLRSLSAPSSRELVGLGDDQGALLASFSDQSQRVTLPEEFVDATAYSLCMTNLEDWMANSQVEDWLDRLLQMKVGATLEIPSNALIVLKKSPR